MLSEKSKCKIDTEEHDANKLAMFAGVMAAVQNVKEFSEASRGPFFITDEELNTKLSIGN